MPAKNKTGVSRGKEGQHPRNGALQNFNDQKNKLEGGGKREEIRKPQKPL